MQGLVVVNRAAGGGRAGQLERPIREHLAALRLDVAVEVPPDPASMEHRLAACAPGTRVAIVGGDGTLQRALPALVEGRLELALVPCGSGNDLARALGIADWPWRRALEWGLRERASGIDLGIVDTGSSRHWFASSLTAGFDSAVSRRAGASPTWLPGRLRYLSATLAEVASLRHWSLEVDADGERVIRGPVLFASVVNTPTFGSGLPVVPQARIDDRRLDLIVAGDFGRRSVLAMLPRLMVGRHLGDPRVHTRTVTEVAVHSRDSPLPLAADGEWLGEFRSFTAHLRAASLGVVRGSVVR